MIASNKHRADAQEIRSRVERKIQDQWVWDGETEEGNNKKGEKRETANNFFLIHS